MNPEVDIPYPPRSWLQSNIKSLYIACLMLLVPLWMLVSWYIFTNQAQNNLQQQIKSDLSLFAESLDSELEKYRFVPKMLVMDATLASTLANKNLLHYRNIHDYLQHIRSVTTADEVFLLDINGSTLASTEFANQNINYAHTPYFQAASAGISGGFFPLGVNAGIRGYYFSEPIFDTKTDDVLGVIVVKVNMSRLERGWLNKRTPMMMTDEYGVVIASSVPSWLFTSRQRLDVAAKLAIKSTSKYPTTSFPELQIKLLKQRHSAQIISLPRPDYNRVLEVSLPLPQLGWQLYGHGDLTSLDFTIQRNTALSVLVFILTVSLAYVIMQRRLQFNESLGRREVNQARLQQAKETLEVRVAKRTQDLQDRNDQLKQAQTELIHAAKLATLGQMATSVTHEINQPLTAIQTSADNAEQWLQRQNYQRVANNLTSIKKLAQKMASITLHLKTFGRKTDNSTSWVALDEAITNAVELVSLRCKQEQVELILDCNHGIKDVQVLADLVRLEQVLINLLTNALDAMLDGSDKQLRITCKIENHGLDQKLGAASTLSQAWQHNICLQVIDTGTGINPQHLAQLFDPFFTTKGTGVGLGLGLSISYSIIDAMGGTLSAENRPQGGAQFCLRLPCKEPASGT